MFINRRIDNFDQQSKQLVYLSTRQLFVYSSTCLLKNKHSLTRNVACVDAPIEGAVGLEV